MDVQALADGAAECAAEWEAMIAELGPDGLERPGACVDWRVRDVLAHFNGWDRWQLVQLRCAFTGDEPTDAELTGGVEFPENDSMAPDDMNAMFYEGNRDRPLEAVVADWREVSEMRAAWLATASQEQLDALVGVDFSGSSGNRNVRLVSEAPGIHDPRTVSEWIVEQIEHQKQHLVGVREWLAGSPPAS